MASATLTIRLDEQDKRLTSEYSKPQGMTLSEFGLTAMLERIEDEIDAADLERAISEDDGERFSMDEVMRMCLEAR